ncbi:MAG: ATP-binding cassette domain-containing protein [Actinomycetota bacterium]|nr:ATP-binding cassette domain-containing protein [Actinomycetota bacterium]
MPELAVPPRSEVPLEIERLGYRYPGSDRDVLHEVSLSVGAGELIVLAGRSASGKTTLLRAACGLVPHFHGGEVSGHVAVAGHDTREAGPGELAGAVGYVAQDPETQVVSTTVRAEIELPLELRGDPAASRARGVEEVALALAIPHLLSRATDTLSGGELQRVALAAALVTRPQLVLLDEPTSQLDPVAGDELIWLLRRLNEEWGVSIVLAEHRLERCLAAADRVVAMDTGEVAFDGVPSDFLAWALSADPALATPGARLFSLAGIEPLPTGVKEARDLLESTGRVIGGAVAPSERFAPERAEREGDNRRSSREWRVRRGHGAHPTTPPPATALEARDLWVELDRGEEFHDVLRGIELHIAAGERVALMGRNGAGKSTFLRTAAHLVKPVRGAIRIPGGIALLGQSPDDYLVREHVAEELPGIEGRRALAAVGLEHSADADPRDLSGGERQRLALAIALAGRAGDGEVPGLVALDEPTRGMDRARKDELAELIGRLAGRGAAVVVATHDVEFAATFAERVVLLGDGVVIADADAAEVLSGGWYFATEVARIVGRPGVVTPQAGAELIGGWE